VTAPSRPRIRENLHVVELDGEAVVYDERTGDLHHLNAVASLVLDLCDGTSTVHDVAGDVASVVQDAPPDIERHVRACIRQLRAVGLLEPTGAVRG
jgi:PqqD family protein of HPr-rel-A system